MGRRSPPETVISNRISGFIGPPISKLQLLSGDGTAPSRVPGKLTQWQSLFDGQFNPQPSLTPTDPGTKVDAAVAEVCHLLSKIYPICFLDNFPMQTRDPMDMSASAIAAMSTMRMLLTRRGTMPRSLPTRADNSFYRTRRGRSRLKGGSRNW